MVVRWRPESAPNAERFAPCRASGRYHRTRVRIPAGTAWSYASAVEPDATAEVGGERPGNGEKDLAKFAQAIREMAQGGSNALGDVTIAAGTTSTTVLGHTLHRGRKGRPLPTLAGLGRRDGLAGRDAARGFVLGHDAGRVIAPSVTRSGGPDASDDLRSEPSRTMPSGDTGLRSRAAWRHRPYRDLLALSADAAVSPANSFGMMDGGIDLAYSRKWGWGVQAHLQALIAATPMRELLVGEALIVPTGDPAIRFCISAPTMRLPGPILDRSTSSLPARPRSSPRGPRSSSTSSCQAWGR